MTVAETFNSFNVPVSIVATDLDTSVLATAAKGQYSRDRVERLSPDRLNRFFLKGGPGLDGIYTVRPELRRLVTFQRINLLEPNWSVRGPLDALFCRNVMIYFDEPTQRRVLERMHRVLKPGGMLFVGHAENFSDSRDLFALRGKTVYERVG